MDTTPEQPSRDALHRRFWRQFGLVLAELPAGMWLEVAEASATRDPEAPVARCHVVRSPEDRGYREALAAGLTTLAPPPLDDFEPGYVYEKDVLVCHDEEGRDELRRLVPGVEEDVARSRESSTGSVMRLTAEPGTGGSRVLDALRGLPDGARVSPNYLVSICNVNLCPADEPRVPSRRLPVPPVNRDAGAGLGTSVVVIDTGLVVNWDLDERLEVYPWLRDEDGRVTGRLEQRDGSDLLDDVPPRVLPGEPWDSTSLPTGEVAGELRGQAASGVVHEYVGHGTFITGVVRCVAPRARVRTYNRLQWAGTTDADGFGRHLLDALADYEDRNGAWPDVISLSAGVRPLPGESLRSLDAFMEELHRRDRTVLVAAAGNDASSAPFYPAAYARHDPKVIAVGALDATQSRRAVYSDHGPWVSVYARGSYLVNAFAFGSYTPLHPDDEIFGERPEDEDGYDDPGDGLFHGLARWSGTSFATPLVAGLIAARMSAAGESSRVAARWLLGRAHVQAVRDRDGEPLPRLLVDQEVR
ncbi:S8/S53 family peptidase [Microbispora sp. H10670]|uniref:S8/S53 family peptidase n=1 Tax=Microbispora sp. H10670 TaxID=2729108 RepID=UPI001603F0E1|nr:S8/S53 family peptidase [Microbispora sp. H10670]